jgi:hypothetical protein
MAISRIMRYAEKFMDIVGSFHNEKLRGAYSTHPDTLYKAVGGTYEFFYSSFSFEIRIGDVNNHIRSLTSHYR